MIEGVGDRDGLMKKVLSMPAGSKVVFSGEGRGGRDVSQTYYIGSAEELRDGRTLVYLARTNKKFPSGKPVLTHVFNGFRINPLGGGAGSRPNTHTLNHIVSVKQASSPKSESISGPDFAHDTVQHEGFPMRDLIERLEGHCGLDEMKKAHGDSVSVGSVVKYNGKRAKVVDVERTGERRHTLRLPDGGTVKTVLAMDKRYGGKITESAGRGQMSGSDLSLHWPAGALSDADKAMDKLYRDLSRFQKDHGRSMSAESRKAVGRALDAMTTLSARLKSAEASFYAK